MWRYIQREGIPGVQRDGRCIMRDDDRMELLPSEQMQMKLGR
ncbi:MAG: hypothetical protein AB7I22_20275 [Ramlibacter sp.]